MKKANEKMNHGKNFAVSHKITNQEEENNAYNSERKELQFWGNLQKETNPHERNDIYICMAFVVKIHA